MARSSIEMLSLDQVRTIINTGSTLFDTYRHVVTGLKRRHHRCRCIIPCEGRFTCYAPSHRNKRAMPYCYGASDDHPTWCDDCWSRKHGRGAR